MLALFTLQKEMPWISSGKDSKGEVWNEKEAAEGKMQAKEEGAGS